MRESLLEESKKIHLKLAAEQKEPPCHAFISSVADGVKFSSNLFSQLCFPFFFFSSLDRKTNNSPFQTFGKIKFNLSCSRCVCGRQK